MAKLTVRFRFANDHDAEGIIAIYAPHCEYTAVSFETIAPSKEEMVNRIQKISRQFPWIVCESESEILGYAYASSHRERAAYQWAADATVYISPKAQRAALGRGLYTALFRILALQGYYKVYAGVTLPNPASVGLHEAVGFQPVGIYRGVGYKLGLWHDVGWWQLELQSESSDPPPPRGFPEIRESLPVMKALDAGAALVRIGSH